MSNTTTTTSQQQIPLFEMFTIPQLIELTGYSEGYLEDLKVRRNRPIPKRFKIGVSRILGMSEERLFGNAA